MVELLIELIKLVVQASWDYALPTIGTSALAAALIRRTSNKPGALLIFRVLDLLAANWLNARNASSTQADSSSS